MINPFDLLLAELKEVKDAVKNMPQVQAVQEVEIIDTKLLCERLALSEPTVITMRKKKQIPFFKVGSAVRYDWAKVLATLERKSK